MPHCEIPALPLSERRAFQSVKLPALVRLSIATLYNEMKRGRLQTIKVGGRRLVTREALDEFLGPSPPADKARRI